MLSESELSQELRYLLLKLRERHPDSVSVYFYDVSSIKKKKEVKNLPEIKIDGLSLSGEEALAAAETLLDLLESGVSPTPPLILRKIRERRLAIISEAKEALRRLEEVTSVIPPERRTVMERYREELQAISTGMFGYSKRSIERAREELDRINYLIRKLASEGVEDRLSSRIALIHRGVFEALSEAEEISRLLGAEVRSEILESLRGALAELREGPKNVGDIAEAALGKLGEVVELERRRIQWLERVQGRLTKVRSRVGGWLASASSLDAGIGINWFTKMSVAVLTRLFVRLAFPSGDWLASLREIDDMINQLDLIPLISETVDSAAQSGIDAGMRAVETLRLAVRRMDPEKATLDDMNSMIEEIRAAAAGAAGGRGAPVSLEIKIDEISEKVSRLIDTASRLVKLGVEADRELAELLEVEGSLKVLRRRLSAGEDVSEELDEVERRVESIGRSVKAKV